MATCEQCGRRFSNWLGDVQRFCPECRRPRLTMHHAVLTDDSEIEQDHPQLDEEVQQRERHASATVILIALNAAVFIAVSLAGRSIFNPPIDLLIRWGADYGPKTMQGQWWRLVTSTFLHGGLLHIAFNMWALFNLGLLAEVLFGRRNYLLMYLLCGIGGSVASLWWHPTVVGVGASGAIFGIAGALLPAIFYHQNEQLRTVLKGNLSSILLFVLYNIIYGMGSARTDNAAHLGGLITGLVLGRLLPTSGPERRTFNARTVAALGGMTAVMIAGCWYTQVANAGIVSLARAHKAVRNGDYEGAIAEARKAEQRDPRMVEPHYLLGTIYLAQKRLPDAISELTRVVEIAPGDADGHKQLCVALLRSSDVNAALTHCARARELDPQDADNNYNLGWVYRARHESAEAAAAFKDAAEARPNSPEENFFYGVALLENNQADLAAAQFEKVLQIKPDYAGAREALEEARAEAATHHARR